MAVRDDFTAGEVLAAADLNDTFASKVPYAYGTATPSTTVDGFVWFDENSTPPAPKFWDGAAFQGIGGGKILQVVSTSSSTVVTNTTTTLTDLLTQTITPSSTSSSILVLSTCQISNAAGSNAYAAAAITRNGSNIMQQVVGNATGVSCAHSISFNLLDAPSTTSSVTYKLRMSKGSGGTNSTNTDNLYTLTLLEIAS